MVLSSPIPLQVDVKYDRVVWRVGMQMVVEMVNLDQVE